MAELRFGFSAVPGLNFVEVFYGNNPNEVPEILARLKDHLRSNEKPVRVLAGEFPQHDQVLVALDHLLIQYKIEIVSDPLWDSKSGNFLSICISPRRI